MAIKIKNSNGEWVVDQKAIETSIIDLNSNFESTNVEGALRELAEKVKNGGNASGGSGNSSLTEEQLNLINQIPNKFDDVKTYINGETQLTVLDFYSNGQKIKSIEISGSGGSGVTSGTLTTTFSNNTVVKTNENVIIPYTLNTENYGEATLYVTIICGEKTKELTYTISKSGIGSANLGILDKGINQISMYAIDAMAKKTNIISLQIICGALEISSTFDDKQDFNDYSNITIPINVSALDSSTMTLNVNIDGNSFTQQVYNGYNSYIYPSTLKTVGVHTVSMQVVTNIYSSNTLEFTIIIASNSQILISTDSTNLTVEEGYNIEIPYRVSMVGQTMFNAKYYINNEVVNELQINLGDNKYIGSYRDFPIGNYIFMVEVSTLDGLYSSTLTVNINVIENSFTRIEHATIGLQAYFDMSTKSNSDNDKDYIDSLVLTDNGKRARLVLHDYNYNTNGWIDGRLVSNGKAWAEMINYLPLEDNVINGFTFDILFNAKNMGDSENRILECVGEDTPYPGFYIDSEKTVLSTESNKLTNAYTDNKDTRITFIVNRTSTYLDKWLEDENGFLIENPNPQRKPNPMLQVFVDGLFTECAMLTDSGSGSNKIYESIAHSNKLLINTDKNQTGFGVSSIKSIRIYNRPLSHEEVLQNKMADIDDLMEQKAMYDKNYVTINQDIPVLYINDTDIGTWDNTSKDNKQWLNIVYNSPNAEKFGESFNLIGQTSWQGTSSLAYPIKNIKFKLYDYGRDASGNIISLTDTSTFVKKKIDLYGNRDGDGYAENVFTVKVDYMESSHCRNTGTARFTSDILFKGNENPAKKIDPMTRDAINGTPCLIYINGERIGLGNFNHDKSCFKTLGMKTIPNTVRWEIKANTDISEGAFYKTWTDGDIDSIYEKILTDYEIVYDEDAFEENSGTYDLTKYYDELNIPYSGTSVSGGYKDYAILSLARYIQFVSETEDEEEFRTNAHNYFNVDRACRYYLNVMAFGMIDNFSKNTIINMYGDDIWWYSFYDCDSSLGLDNTGYMKFEPDIEPSQPNVYNCSNSKMWVKLNAFFKTELYNNFKALRESNYTYEKVCEYLIENQIDQIPDILYNEDMYSKYITQGRRYLHMLHGNNKAHLLRWLYNRFLYVDSLFLQHNSPYTKESITIRSCKPTEVPSDLPEGVQYIPKFEIETYTPQYVTVCWRKNTYETKRVGKGEKVIFENQMTNSQDNELIVYCANNLKRIGDCSDKNPTSIDIGFATRLVEFKCENSTELLKADLSKNRYLREVSFNGCSQLGNTTGGANVLDVSSCTNLRKVDVRGTAITTVQTNVDGGNLEEIYYGSSIQNITIKNQTNLKVLGLPIEPPPNLVTVDITNCPNVEKLNVSADNYNNLSSMKYVQNLSIQNSLDLLTSISFKGFNKLKTFKLQDMLYIASCGLDDMYNAEDVSTLTSITFANCPKITTLTMNVTSNDKYVKFNNNATLDLRYATSIKTITSNTSILGLKTVYLPNSLENLLFGYEYHTDVPGDIVNVWSNDSVSNCLAENYEGVDGKNLNIKNIDLSSVKKIPNIRNLNVILGTSSKFIINQTRDGSTYPYLVYRGTVNLDNYEGNLIGFFKGWKLENVVIIKNNDFTQTDFTSMFEDAILGDMDLTSLFNKMPNATNLNSMFKNTDLTSDILIPSNVVDCSSMFKGCTSMAHIHSNWNESVSEHISSQTDNYINVKDVSSIHLTFEISSYYYIKGYDKNFNFVACYNGSGWVNEIKKINAYTYDIASIGDNISYILIVHDKSGIVKFDAIINHKPKDVDAIISTDCYSGCTAITHVDGENVIKSDYSEGLDQVPIGWGGYGFFNDVTTIIEIEVPSDNYNFNPIVHSNLFTIRQSPKIVWGDNTSSIITNLSDTTQYSHVYKKSGTYIIKGHFSFGDGLSNNKNELKKVFQICVVKNLAYAFSGCSNLTYVNLSAITKACSFGYAFRSCYSLETVDGLEYINPTETASMFTNCTSLTRLNGVQNLNMSNVSNASRMFNGCSSLTSLNISNWNTSNVTDMSYMFANCSSLTSLNLNGWNVSNVVAMNSMFNEDHYLSELNLSTWVDNGTKVKSLDNFFSCNNGSTANEGSFITVTLPSIKVNNAIAIFAFNKHIKNADFTNLDFSECESMWKICGGCSYLEAAIFNVEGNYDNIIDIKEAFYNCGKLISTNLMEVI